MVLTFVYVLIFEILKYPTASHLLTTAKQVLLGIQHDTLEHGCDILLFHVKLMFIGQLLNEYLNSIDNIDTLPGC